MRKSTTIALVGALIASMAPMVHADEKLAAPSQSLAAKMDAKAEQSRENVVGGALFKEIQAAQAGALHRVIPMGGKPWGNAVPLYVFVDPNCKFCHDFVSYAVKHESDFKKADVQPVFITIAFLKASSAGRAAAIVDQGWPAFLENDQKYTVKTEEGGVTPLPVSAKFKDQFYAIKDNTDLISNFAKTLHMATFGTPFLIYKDSRDDVVYLKGMPKPELMNQIIESASRLKTVHWNGVFKP